MSSLHSADHAETATNAEPAPPSDAQPAAPPPRAARCQTGLLDLQALAAQLATSRGADDMPSLGFFGASIVPPLLPRSLMRGAPRWVAPTLIALGLAVLGSSAVAVLFSLRAPPAPVVTIRPDVPRPVVAQMAAIAPVASPARSSEPPRRVVRKVRDDAPSAPVRAPASAPSAAPAPAPADDLDALLARALRAPAREAARPARIDTVTRSAPAAAPSPASAAAPSSPAASPAQLGRAEVQRGFASVQPRAERCARPGATGPVPLRVTIAPDGHVAKAQAGGALAGSPASACVEAAVRDATFPRFAGAATTVAYVYVLR